MAIKYNLKTSYKYFEKFEKLGINFFVGDRVFEDILAINDHNFMSLICCNSTSPVFRKRKSIQITNDSWFQTREFCVFLQKYFQIKYVRNNVIDKNIYKKRYNNNQDVFVHVRLGDVSDKVLSVLGYYEKILSRIEYTNGFIASDSINSDICQELMNKYKLLPIQESEVETIMFASTCSFLVLSGGTFSWLMGFLAFDAEKIYYPNILEPWYGDIFTFFSCSNKWVAVDF